MQIKNGGFCMKIKNKVFLNVLLITLTLSSIAYAPEMGTQTEMPGYQPARGPLMLGDEYVLNLQNQRGPLKIQRGIIMDTILKNPDLSRERLYLYNFTNTPANAELPLYQEIVDALRTSSDKNAIAVIESFETAIMKILHYEHYFFYSEGKWSNMFLTGLRRTWFSPSDWVNISTWLPSYTSPDIAQLMNEIKQLSQIAQRHSIALSLRLSNKADSYLYWKTRTLKTLAALGAITGAYYYRNDIKDLLNTGYDSVVSLPNNASNFGSNIYNAGSNFARASYNTGYNAAASLGNSALGVGSSAYNAGYNAAASVGNRALGIADSAYNTAGNWGQYLRNYWSGSNE